MHCYILGFGVTIYVYYRGRLQQSFRKDITTFDIDVDFIIVLFRPAKESSNKISHSNRERHEKPTKKKLNNYFTQG